MSSRVILGVDPGLANTGWGVIRHDGLRGEHVAHGVIETEAGTPPSQRLLTIYRALEGVVDQYKPVAGGIETLYFVRNVSSALPVAEARGVILLAMAARGLEVREFTPMEIKQAVVGTGRADKKQVQTMVALVLNLRKPPKADHAADALAAAVALAHGGKVG